MVGADPEADVAVIQIPHKARRRSNRRFRFARVGDFVVRSATVWIKSNGDVGIVSALVEVDSDRG
ncbi:MAG: hypothetical protein CM1200mP18_16210 [Gammaproteobacteria bacterium]|nr:MAG: hypothetical protein CM1200mP18_16210 [Gammaproteobacteria bacterium]